MVWEKSMPRLSAALRPRWTWRSVVGYGVATYVAYCFLFSTPLFSSRLPAYTGPYTVGTMDLEIPCESRRTHDARFKEGELHAFKVGVLLDRDGAAWEDAALLQNAVEANLDTVLFSLYYPAVKDAISDQPQHLWMPRPLGVVATGYARFARISNAVANPIFTFFLWLLVGGTQIPAQVDVPLHNTPVISQSPDTIIDTVATHDGFPVMVFSHGMASSRTQYSQYCGELASRGYVVAAIEHRDGSGPGTVVKKHQQPDRPILYFSHRDLVSSQSEIFDADAFKQAQLDFRQAEVDETVRVLRLINIGQGYHISSLNSRGEGRHLHDWRGQLAINNMTMGGHSFGATLALQTLRNGASAAFPFQSAVVLDPGKSSGPLNDDVHVSTLVIHSNSWSRSHSIFVGRPHFDVVKDLVRGIVQRGKDAWFMTSLGTTHPSVTDAPLIQPFLLRWTTGSSLDAHEAVRQYVHVSENFLRFQTTGLKPGLLAECVTHPEYDSPTDEGSHEVRGGHTVEKYLKFWQIHVAPCGLD